MLQTLISYAPMVFAVIGLLFTFATALHTFLLALSALPLGGFATFCGKAASVVGVVAADLQKVLAWFSRLPGNTTKNVAGGALLLVVVLVSLPSCTSSGRLTPGAKTVVTSIDDVARRLCLLATADSMGVSVADVARDACTTEAALEPFLHAALGAKQAGAVQAGLARP